MNTLILFVSICTSVANVNGEVHCYDANSFEPLTWSITSEKEEEKALEECSLMANAYQSLEAVEDVDCYFDEVK